MGAKVSSAPIWDSGVAPPSAFRDKSGGETAREPGDGEATRPHSRKVSSTVATGAPSAMILDALFFLIQAGLTLFFWAILIAAILSLLIGFGILDTRNRLVWSLSDFFYRVTEPAMRPVRNLLPNLGSVDISPLVVMLLVQACMLLVGAIQGYLIRGGLYF